MNIYRVLEHVHGHLSVLAVAAMFHPAVLLQRQKRRAGKSLWIACLMTAGAFGLGLGIYPRYRIDVKPHIFRSAPAFGWLFERKEHLAFGTLCLLFAGAFAYASRPHFPKSDEELWRLARVCVSLGAVLGLLVAILGVVVASYRSFPQ